MDGKRFWYSTQPTVTRLADDRASQLEQEEHKADVEEEIARRLREEARVRGDFAKVHPCLASGDIPDDEEARLVILGPQHPHTAKDAKSPARVEAAAILESRGSSPRNCKNAVVFLAPDSNRLRELEQAVRQFMAWTSIWTDRETLNLDPFQTKQAETRCRAAEETVEARIPETYQWLLVPGQPDPRGAIEWTEIRLQGRDALAKRASKKLTKEELLMVELGGTRLKHELDRVPLWRGNHVGLRQLVEDMAKYLYLPRLRDESVLREAVCDGVAQLTWRSETFAYAEGWDEQRQRYLGLKAGQAVRVVIDTKSLLVKPEVADAQMKADAEQQAQAAVAGGGGPGGGPGPGDGPGGAGAGATSGGGTDVVEPPPVLNRFHGSVRLDAVRLGRDASRIAEEIVQHLSGIVGADVEITLEIQAQLPEGASDKLVRDVTENCRTLKFESYGFEES